MIIIKIMGGFASQLHKYLFGYRLSLFFNTEFALDLTDYIEGYFRKYCLDDVELPNVKKFYTQKELQGIFGRLTVHNSKEMFRCLKYKNKDIHVVGEEKDYADFLESFSVLKVMPDDERLRSLKLKKESTFLTAFQKKIKDGTNIAVHVRRGDFAALGWADSVEFFKGVICKIFHEIDDSQFYFFSNEIEWCKEEFGYHDRFSYISSLNMMTGDLEELFCMSYCEIRILSKLSGYGILANQLGVCHRVGSYAVLEGSGREKNGLQQLETGNKKEYSEKGSVCYLESKEYIPWAEKFKHIFVEENKGQKEFPIDTDYDKWGLQRKYISIQEYDNLLEKRYKSSQQQYGFAERSGILEKLQLHSNSQLNVFKEWRKLYHIRDVELGCVVILSHQKKDNWKRTPLQRMGIILSRAGYRVLFINMFDVNKKKTIFSGKSIFLNMKDMDGVEFNVLSIEPGKLASIQDIRNQIHKLAYAQDSRVLFVSDFLNPFAESLDKQIKISGLMDTRSYIRLLLQSKGYPLLSGIWSYARGRVKKMAYKLKSDFSQENDQLLEHIEKNDVFFARSIIDYAMREVEAGE